MSKVSKVVSISAWDYDELYPILQDAFLVLYISYSILLDEKKVDKYRKPTAAKRWYLEDTITNDLIKGSENIEKSYSYRFQKQQEDFETNAKIDIAVLYSLKFGDNSNDLKIECKRLDNISYIINDGIESFKQNKYSEKLPIAGMLLYNIRDDIKENMEYLKTKIIEKFSRREILEDLSLVEDYKYTYRSTHTRINNSSLDLYTFALDFEHCISI